MRLLVSSLLLLEEFRKQLLNLCLMRLLVSSLLLLEEFRKQLLVCNMSLLGGSPLVLLRLGIQFLSSKSLLCDQSLNLWRFVESFFDLGGIIALLLHLLLNGSGNNVLSDIILLSEGECSSDVIGSLWTESSWLLLVSEAWNFTDTLLEHSQENNGEVWSTDASSHGLSLSLTSSSRSVKRRFFLKENSNSAVD